MQGSTWIHSHWLPFFSQSSLQQLTASAAHHAICGNVDQKTSWIAKGGLLLMSADAVKYAQKSLVRNVVGYGAWLAHAMMVWSALVIPIQNLAYFTSRMRQADVCLNRPRHEVRYSNEILFILFIYLFIYLFNLTLPLTKQTNCHKHNYTKYTYTYTMALEDYHSTGRLR